MGKVRAGVVVALSAAIVAGSIAAICAEPNAAKPEFAIRKIEAQTVLYTLYRGPYDKMGRAIGKLYALAGQKQIPIRGALSMVYLNNPEIVADAHWLVELRIPVDKDAQKLAGTLGEFTDVKALPAMEVAVVTKPEGVAEPGTLMEKLSRWVLNQGYESIDAPWETFLSISTSGDYAGMRTEITMPVRKLAEQE